MRVFSKYDYTSNHLKNKIEVSKKKDGGRDVFTTLLNIHGGFFYLK